MTSGFPMDMSGGLRAAWLRGAILRVPRWGSRGGPRTPGGAPARASRPCGGEGTSPRGAASFLRASGGARREWGCHAIPMPLPCYAAHQAARLGKICNRSPQSLKQASTNPGNQSHGSKSPERLRYEQVSSLLAMGSLPCGKPPITPMRSPSPILVESDYPSATASLNAT